MRLVRATETYQELAEFEGGVDTLEPVLFRLRRSLEQLTRRLRADLLLAGEITIILDLEDRTTLERTIHIPAPTCEVDVLFRVAATYLDTDQDGLAGERVPPGGVSQARRATTKPVSGKAALRDPQRLSRKPWPGLGGIVGAEHVGTPQRLPTHRPNRFGVEPPDFEHATNRAPATRAGTAPSSHECMRHPASCASGLGLRRYRPPVEGRRWRVRADHRPAWLQAREVARQNPGERRTPGGWTGAGGTRTAAWRWEEWDVELALGGLYRLANHRQAHWWMLGVYD